MSKKEQLEHLNKQIIDKQVCKNLMDQSSQLVFGEGNVNAKVVLIGEAPGKKEDQIGKPFVGASGRMLDKLLSHIGSNRKDVYITNLVKYRPPDNRDPLKKEKKAFWPYLLRQIEIINPKAVVTLGRHSGQLFIKNLKISADHGKIQIVSVRRALKEFNISVLPLYHPAAALYNGSLRKVLFEDFEQVKLLIEKEN